MEKNKSKTRMIIVILFLAIFIIGSYTSLRGTYLQYKELGENYIQAFATNLQCKYIIFGINFVMLYIIMYFTNRGIKKGLKPFFEKENKEMPKLLNKSIAFVTSVIVSTLVSNTLMKQFLLCASNVSFGISDPVFGLDIAFYMFQKPFVQTILGYFTEILIGLTIYMAVYYVIVFNRFFDGVDGKMVRESLLVKKILRNAVMVVILIALINALNITNISLSKMLTIKNDVDSTENIEIIGASYTDVMVQRWGYLIFSFVIIFGAMRAIKAFKKNDTVKVLKNLAIIPGYLVVMFLVIN